MSLSDALANIVNGDTLVLLDGVYTQDTMSVTGGTTIRANTGARPVIVASFGTPYVTLGDGTYLSGVWFGGLRQEQPTGTIDMGDNCIMEDCVLFNSYEGALMNNNGSIIRRTKFINCGGSTLWHSIYINGGSGGADNLVEDSIFVGGQAYHIQLWHDPTDGIVRNNFSADAQYCLVPQGNNHVATHNVFWKPSSPGYPINLTAGSNRTYTNNYHGPIAAGSERSGRPTWFGAAMPAGITSGGNYYYDITLVAGDDPTSPTITQNGDEVTFLGKSAAQIDAAWQALETSFADTVQNIHDDTTIAGNFAVLKVCIDTWNLN